MQVHRGADPQMETMDTLLANVLLLEAAEPMEDYHVTPVRLGDRVVFQSDLYAVRLARESDLLPMELGHQTNLRDGVWLVQEGGYFFVAVLSYKGAEEEAEKIQLLEQMDWRN